MGQEFSTPDDDHRRTVDQVRSGFGGSEALPLTPPQIHARRSRTKTKRTRD